MTTTNGWPGKPGVPLNPDRDGWHWLLQINGQYPEVWEWASGPDEYGAWCESEGDGQPKEIAKWYRYLGPVLKPDEVAKREDVKWHEGYAVGVLDVRRGTAFGEPDPHYAALQKRCEEAERERDALRRDTSKQVATDELVRRLQHLGDWQASDRIEAQAAEITHLRAELATARREGMEEAANRLEELHKNHNYDPESGTLTRKLGRYDRWPESAKTAKLEHDTGYYRAIAEGVAHILAAAGEGKP